MLKVLINNIVRWSRRTVKFFREDIWDIEVTELSKAKARFVNLSRIVTKTFKDFADHAIGFQTVALSYFCTMAFVPFIAVAFAVTNGFGLADKLKERFSIRPTSIKESSTPCSIPPTRSFLRPPMTFSVSSAP